ncbi:MAG: QueT transporter family protein [Lachnospiraceae bacterium]|nr:QueT transporter family protein [Lachnospiraceae bacterium]MDY5742157.1 QueT transporter family protein [Lachnospiraceae bacterium]
MNETTKRIVLTGVIAAIYAVLTYVIAPFAYGPIQFRFSEVMVLLAFVSPIYIPGLVLGCVLGNLMSPFGAIDIVVGSAATAIACLLMARIKNIWVASLMPAIINGLIIGLEIMMLSDEPINFWLTAGEIFLSELIIVTVIGVPILLMLMKNQVFKKKLTGQFVS